MDRLLQAFCDIKDLEYLSTIVDGVDFYIEIDTMSNEPSKGLLHVSEIKNGYCKQYVSIGSYRLFTHGGCEDSSEAIFKDLFKRNVFICDEDSPDEFEIERNPTMSFAEAVLTYGEDMTICTKTYSDRLTISNKLIRGNIEERIKETNKYTPAEYLDKYMKKSSRK